MKFKALTITAIWLILTGSTAFAAATEEECKAVGAWKRGMAVYTIAGGGLMYEASIGGQKFKYTPLKD